jgi:beta-glucosidase
MCSYNQISGVPSCSNEATLVNVLRDEFQFRGFVQSDWWANHETSSVTKGLDQDMPGTKCSSMEFLILSMNYVSRFIIRKITDIIPTLEHIGTDGYFDASKLSKLNDTKAVDNAVTNLLAAMYHMNALNTTRCTAPAKDGCLASNVTSEKHRDLAERLATESIVLLRNENETLPLQNEKIAVIGSVASARQSDGWGPFHWFEGGDYYSGGGTWFENCDISKKKQKQK